MAGPAVRSQSPKVGAGWFSDHVRICAGVCAAMRIPTAIALRNCFITVANRDLILPMSLTKRLVNHARPQDVTEGYARRLDHGAASRRRPSASPSLKSG